jgi:hypothetical protein
VLKTFYKKKSANEFLFIFSNRGLKGLLKKVVSKKMQRNRPPKKTTFLGFFLSRFWALLAEGSPKSEMRSMLYYHMRRA